MKPTTGAMQLYTGSVTADELAARDRNAKLLDATLISAMFGAVVVLLWLLFSPLL